MGGVSKHADAESFDNDGESPGHYQRLADDLSREK